MDDRLIVILIVLLYFSPVFYQIFSLLKEKKEERKILLRKMLKFFKYSVLILIPIVVSIGIFLNTNYLDYEKPITFDRYDSITFNNFRGLEFFKKSLYGNERFAYVVTTIETDINDSYVTVEALFHPSKSFVYNKNTNSVDLLTHEKYHFKITELFSRKIKERISELNNPSKEKLETIIEEVVIEEARFQKAYDYDTFHSYVLSEQKRYEREIDSILNTLNNYKKPKIIINETN